jgi:hypothetical protein
MGKKMKDKNCQVIQNMIISGNYDKLNSDDSQKIQDHINRCKTCGQYQELMNNISNSMKIQEFKDPDIENKIRRNLIGYLKKKQKIYSHKNLWYLILQFFKYRIPIYQSVLAFIVIFFMLYAMKNIHFNEEKKDIIIKSVDSLTTYPVPREYNYLIENLDIIEAQRVGESILDDSSVVQFSYSIL